MISPDGRTVWWQSTSLPKYKVSIPLDMYLFHVNYTQNLTHLRRAVLNDPTTTITPLTEDEAYQVSCIEGATHHGNYKQPCPIDKVLAKGV